jgi:hypothetical protein
VTVCIAAACENGQIAVVASDRMLSAPFLTIEFDHPDAKIDLLGNRCVALTAGDALSVQDILVGGLGVASQLQDPAVELIAQHVRNRFAEVRKRRINEMILGPRGMDFDMFYAGGIQNLPRELGMFLDSEIQQARLGSSIILAGVDASGAHIFAIEDPGATQCFDRLGYHSVGSGHRHALLTLVSRGQHLTDNLSTTVFNVFAAKRAAELAPGVGTATEMRVISTNGGVFQLSQDDIDRLDIILQEDVKPRETTSEAISKLAYGRQDNGKGKGARGG